jgi:NADH-quinone oxidoreductase subunit J
VDFKDIIFYLLAGFTLVTAVLTVSAGKIFRSAIYLLFCMMGVAGIYFWLNYEFVAAVQIVVYVGGIVVLIIFSIFLTQHVGTEMQKSSKTSLLFCLLAVLLSFAFCFTVICKNEFAGTNNHVTTELTAEKIGTQMLSLNEHGYILPFEVVSILLLAAMIGCIVIALKTPLHATKQEAAKIEA